LKNGEKAAIYKSDDKSGAIAQLGERYDGIVEVRSSILLGSTKSIKDRPQRKTIKDFNFLVLPCHRSLQNTKHAV
jgi:hypothetical protein